LPTFQFHSSALSIRRSSSRSQKSSGRSPETRRCLLEAGHGTDRLEISRPLHLSKGSANSDEHCAKSNRMHVYSGLMIDSLYFYIFCAEKNFPISDPLAACRKSETLSMNSVLRIYFI